jgi:hypothetical protein
MRIYLMSHTALSKAFEDMCRAFLYISSAFGAIFGGKGGAGVSKAKFEDLYNKEQ